MNLFRISAVLVGGFAIVSEASAQGAPFQMSFTQGANGTWNADWIGPDSGPDDATHRTFFFQWSLELVNWNYAPFMEFGTGLKSYGMDTQGEMKCFVRLHHVDDDSITTLQQARDADFDGDGIPSYYEVENLFTNPLDKNSAGGDSNSNSLPDGWELYYFGGLGIADPAAALQPDGLTNKEKAELGLNPNTDYSAANATQPAAYAYDGAGRLTGVTAPVGTAGFTPDEEGNITNAQ